VRRAALAFQTLVELSFLLIAVQFSFAAFKGSSFVLQVERESV
jgi:hypothetical protein